MTREQAVRRLRRLLGKRARWRVTKGLTSPEKRAAARAALEAVRDERRRCPYDEVERLKALQAQESALFIAQFDYRFKIFRNEGWMNIEVGQGDTWEEAFASIEPAPTPRREVVGRAS
jgi:hypothetical protein